MAGGSGWLAPARTMGSKHFACRCPLAGQRAREPPRRLARHPCVFRLAAAVPAATLLPYRRARLGTRTTDPAVGIHAPPGSEPEPSRQCNTCEGAPSGYGDRSAVRGVHAAWRPGDLAWRPRDRSPGWSVPGSAHVDGERPQRYDLCSSPGGGGSLPPDTGRR